MKPDKVAGRMVIDLKRRWKTWRGLDRKQKTLFWQALILLRITSLLLRFFLFQDVYRFMKVRMPLRNPTAPDFLQNETYKTVKMVESAARRRVSNATCLRRSLVLWYLLRRQGIDSDLRLGVFRSEGEFAAHAWVEIDGTVINDDVNFVQKYTVMNLDKES